MKNILIKFIKNRKKCTHKNALLCSQCGYCPDCGEYVVKNYYILRCACCDIKREAKLVFGEIMPAEKYCSNCGSDKYYLEKLDKINFIDAQYAISVKEIANKMQVLHPEVQIWVEKAGVIKQISIKKDKKRS